MYTLGMPDRHTPDHVRKENDNKFHYCPVKVHFSFNYSLFIFICYLFINQAGPVGATLWQTGATPGYGQKKSNGATTVPCIKILHYMRRKNPLRFYMPEY
jgi:hypothetical protein